MARYNRTDAPYNQSRAALRERYGSRTIDASAPNVADRNPSEKPAAPGGQGGLSSEQSWRAFFGPKPAAQAASGPPMLWDKIRQNVTNKPIGDQMWKGIMADTSPMRGAGLPTQPAALAPEDAPDPMGMASLYEPPAQFGGPRSLLQDPEGFGSLDSPIGGSSAFFRKYGKMRDLSTLGQDNFIL